MKPHLTKFPKTDYQYTAARLADFGSRCVTRKSATRAFRKMSDNYFQHEAPRTFVGEAFLFAAIAMTAALPLLSNVSALAHLVRVTGNF